MWPGSVSRIPILFAPDRFDRTTLRCRTHLALMSRTRARLSSPGRCCLSWRPGEHFLRRADRPFALAAPGTQANPQQAWSCCSAAWPYRSKRGGCWALLPTGIRWFEPAQARKTRTTRPTEQRISWQILHYKTNPITMLRNIRESRSCSANNPGAGQLTQVSWFYQASMRGRFRRNRRNQNSALDPG